MKTTTMTTPKPSDKSPLFFCHYCRGWFYLRHFRITPWGARRCRKKDRLYKRTWRQKQRTKAIQEKAKEEPYDESS